MIESVHGVVFGFDLCVCMCFGVWLRCCTHVFTLALGLGLRTLAAGECQQMWIVKRLCLVH